MIWVFERDDDRLRCEITRDGTGSRYLLVVTTLDGTQSVEDIAEPTALIERSVEVMASLRRDGWRIRA
jgi:hypothetical protein